MTLWGLEPCLLWMRKSPRILWSLCQTRFSGLKNARTVYAFEQELIATQQISWVLDATLKLIAYYIEHQMRPITTSNRRLMKELEDFALSEARYRGVYLDSFYNEWGIPEDKQTFSAYCL